MRGTAKSESEQKMKMVWGRVLLLAATVAGLEVAIEDYFGDVTFLQGEHSKKKYDCYSSYGIICQTWPDPHYHDIREKANGGVYCRRPRPCRRDSLENRGQVDFGPAP